MIPIWKKNLNSKEIKDKIKFSLSNKMISEGKLTYNVEKKISKILGIKHTVMVASGTSALLVAMISLGLKANDTILIPERAWVSLLNAAAILKLKIVTIDVKKNKPIIEERILERIKRKIRAIVVVHMGGRACEMKKIMKFAKKRKIRVIEDAAQAFGSKYNNRNLGTFGDIGCFSLSMAKTITSGQGGFLITNKTRLFEKIKKIKNNGLVDIMNIDKYGQLGLNFKYTDIAACLLLSELKKFRLYKKQMKNLYIFYKKNIIKSKSLYVLDFDLKKGEIPQYIEVVCKKRNKYVNYMLANNIQCRKFYPSISNSKFTNSNPKKKLNDKFFSQNGIFLPSGTHQKLSDIKKIINLTNIFIKKNFLN